MEGKKTAILGTLKQCGTKNQLRTSITGAL